jgi:hypothetical protein
MYLTVRKPLVSIMGGFFVTNRAMAILGRV